MKALEKVAQKFGAECAAAESALTEKQFTEALAQALACGDFLRHVRIDNGAQAVTYEPYRECERLKARIRELEQQLDELREPDPKAALEDSFL